MKAEVEKALKNATSDPEIVEIVGNEAQVLKRFNPIFQPSSVGNLDENDFRNFLKFEHNKHWSSLERQNNRLCEDMDALRGTLGVLVDETRPINRRVDEALKLHGMGKGTLSAILLIAYPDSYGVWNGASEKAMRHLGLWPSFPRGATEGDKYLAANKVLRDIADKLGVSLWKLDALLWGVDLNGDGFGGAKSGNKGTLNKGRVFSSREKSIWDIENNVIETVRNSNGQTAQTTIKRKDLLMSERELEARIEELLDQGGNRCTITGLHFEFVGDGDDLNMRPSLDRIDSGGHYKASNMQLVCRFINFWKQATPDDEFRHLIHVVRESCGADTEHSAE